MAAAFHRPGARSSVAHHGIARRPTTYVRGRRYAGGLPERLPDARVASAACVRRSRSRPSSTASRCPSGSSTTTGRVVLANPAALATLGYEDLSELRGRFGHDPVHYMHPDGSPYPAAECPMLEPPGPGAPVHIEEDWFVRRDGTLLPGLLHLGADRPAGRARRGRHLHRHDRAARGRAGAARARRDPRPGRASRSGSSTTRAASTTPTRPRWPRSATRIPRSSSAGRATRRSTTSTPTARRSRPRTAR